MTRSMRLAVTLLTTIASAAVRADVTAYTGATLIDGTGRGAVDNATVLVTGDRIAAAGSGVEVPAGARRVDVRGKWIVPGLIDAHVHFMTSGRMYTRPAFFDLTDKVPYEEEVEWIKAHIPDTLRAFMCSGVTSVLSLGGPSLEYDTRDLARSLDRAPTVFIGHGVIAHAPRLVAERMIPPWDGELTLIPVVSVRGRGCGVSGRRGTGRRSDQDCAGRSRQRGASGADVVVGLARTGSLHHRGSRKKTG